MGSPQGWGTAGKGPAWINVNVRGSPPNMTNIAVLYLDDPLYQPDDDNFMETLIASHMTKLPTGAWVCNFCNKESKFKRNIGRL